MKRRGLSRPVRHGAWWVAAIVETEITTWRARGRIGGAGGKRPLAVIIFGPGGLRGTDAAGAALDRGEIEALLPGALDRFATEAGIFDRDM